MWLPEKEESEMTSRRNIFKLLAGAAIAPKVVADIHPQYILAGFDPAYGQNGMCYMRVDGLRWNFVNGEWVRCTEWKNREPNPDYISCVPST